MENMLDKVRDGSVEFDKRAAEFILNVISDVKTLVNDLVNKKKPVLPKTYSMLTDVSTNILEHTEKAPVITDDVKIFLAQVDQFLEMIEMSIDSPPSGNHIINRAANGLRNAAKFIGFNDLTELAENFAKKKYL